jgi:hypothetical protein
LAQAEEYIRRHHALAEQIGDRAGIGFGWKTLGEIALERGELLQAETYSRRGLVILEENYIRFGVAECWGCLGWVACERGDLTTAARWCREARRLALRTAEPDLAAHASVSDSPLRSSGASQRRRRWPGPGRPAAAPEPDLAAHALFVHVAALLRGRPSAPRLRAAGLLLARGRALTGNPGWQRLGGRAALLEARLALCRAALSGEQDLWTPAQHAAEAAWRLAHDTGLGQEEALAERLLGECARAQDDVAAAEARLRSALEHQVAMGTALEAARTRLVLAQTVMARAAAGEIPQEAREHLAAAQAQFAVSGAAWDLAQAERLAAAWAVR